MGKQKKKKEFNDLLLPIMLVLAVVPFITRLIVYDSKLSKYRWYSDFGVVTDFFTYYKSVAFIIIAIISLIILVIDYFLRRRNQKSGKAFWFLGIYGFLVILSTVLSVDRHSSIIGGMGRFENVFVLLGYLVMIVYGYRIKKTEDDYNILLKVMIVSLTVMSVVGILQLLGMDLISMKWFQKMIIPRDYWKDYLGNLKSQLKSNAVSLTLFNPNYSAVYLSMMISFFVVFLLPARDKMDGNKSFYVQDKKMRYGLALLLVILLLLLYKTYSRTGLLSLFASLLILGAYYRKWIIRNMGKLIIMMVVGIALFVGVDAANHFRYLEKILGTVTSLTKPSGHSLEEIITTKENIIIRYKGNTIKVSFAKDFVGSLVFINEEGENISTYYDEEKSQLLWNNFDEIKFYIEQKDHNNYILCEINDIYWRFSYSEKEGYLYVNDLDKKDHLTDISQIGFHNLEHIASGRGYIWSRSIPLLKDNLLIGKGPDTFLLQFPQSDYVGKANNCKTPYTLIEKPHNFYLSMGLQTGVLSLIAFLIFYFLYLRQSVLFLRNNSLKTMKDQMALACLLSCVSYMISGLFNDSSLHTTPIFCVLIGMGMDINEKIEGGK